MIGIDDRVYWPNQEQADADDPDRQQADFPIELALFTPRRDVFPDF